MIVHLATGREEASTAGSESELTPAQLQLRHMVLDSVTSAHSRRNYAKALDLLFTLAAGRPLTRALLMEDLTSMEGLAPSTVNIRLSAIRKLVTEARRNGHALCRKSQQPDRRSALRSLKVHYEV